MKIGDQKLASEKGRIRNDLATLRQHRYIILLRIRNRMLKIDLSSRIRRKNATLVIIQFLLISRPDFHIRIPPRSPLAIPTNPNATPLSIPVLFPKTVLDFEASLPLFLAIGGDLDQG